MVNLQIDVLVLCRDLRTRSQILSCVKKHCKYRAIIGGLNYLALCTRPDLSLLKKVGLFFLALLFIVATRAFILLLLPCFVDQHVKQIGAASRNYFVSVQDSNNYFWTSDPFGKLFGTPIIHSRYQFQPATYMHPPPAHVLLEACLEICVWYLVRNGKFEDRAKSGYLGGNDSGNKCRSFLSDSNKVVASRDMKIDENWTPE